MITLKTKTILIKNTHKHRPRCTSPSSIIDPVFLSTYVDSICNIQDTYNANICASTIIIPPIEKQLKVMNMLRTTSEYIDISPITGALMTLLIQERYDEYKQLVDIFVEYHIQVELLHHTITSIVDSAQHNGGSL